MILGNIATSITSCSKPKIVKKGISITFSFSYVYNVAMKINQQIESVVWFLVVDLHQNLRATSMNTEWAKMI